jgi:hypothetical protein
MKQWTDTIDPATIPDDVLYGEIGRRRSAARRTFTGGRNGGRPRKADTPATVTKKAKQARGVMLRLRDLVERKESH